MVAGMIRSVDDPLVFMPDHLAKQVAGKMEFSVDGFLGLLPPNEGSILRLSDRPLHVQTQIKTESYGGPRRRWLRGYVFLHDRDLPLLFAHIVFEISPKDLRNLRIYPRESQIVFILQWARTQNYAAALGVDDPVDHG